jgi:hypothetical protein
LKNDNALAHVLDDFCGKPVLLLLDGELATNIKRGILKMYREGREDSPRVAGVYQLTDRFMTATESGIPLPTLKITYVFEISRVIWIAIDPDPDAEIVGESVDVTAGESGALTVEELAKLGIQPE